MSFLEDTWREREDKVYKQIFENVSSNIYPLSFETFKQMNINSVDPRWLSYGVFKCAPTQSRDTWVYVTSGMSNPWISETPEEYSGFGMEFLMETIEENTWAIEVLQSLMAYNILLFAGKMGDFPPLDYGHRVPFSLSESIKAMMFTYPVKFPNDFSIQSGKVDFLQVVGITQRELDFAKQNSSTELEEIIIQKTAGLVTDKERSSVI